MSEKMEKKAVRFEPELKAEIQDMMNEANATSISRINSRDIRSLKVTIPQLFLKNN